VVEIHHREVERLPNLEHPASDLETDRHRVLEENLSQFN